jgi:hypothetical protein
MQKHSPAKRLRARICRQQRQNTYTHYRRSNFRSVELVAADECVLLNYDKLGWRRKRPI